MRTHFSYQHLNIGAVFLHMDASPAISDQMPNGCALKLLRSTAVYRPATCISTLPTWVTANPACTAALAFQAVSPTLVRAMAPRCKARCSSTAPCNTGPQRVHIAASHYTLVTRTPHKLTRWRQIHVVRLSNKNAFLHSQCRAMQALVHAKEAGDFNGFGCHATQFFAGNAIDLTLAGAQRKSPDCRGDRGFSM